MRTPARKLVLPPRPSSVAEARRFVDRALRRLGAPTSREVGVLLASELVTNALLYAQSTITLAVTRREQAVRVTVHDENPHVVQARRVHAEAMSGRGLALVERLASAWGVDPLPQNGKVVWFELPLR
jgi:anti-sigma regulatory factor (Ser/Thr protein kinase)